jgi:predicted O-methyltransferase YrrM
MSRYPFTPSSTLGGAITCCRLRSLTAFIWDTVNLAAALGPRAPLPDPGGWAASAELLVELARRVIEERPRLVVELGSGLSTIVSALTLRQVQDARLVSIDHDTDYAVRTQRQLAANHLSGLVDVRVAPLVETTKFGRPMLWYDTSGLDDLVDIDLGPDDSMRKSAQTPILSPTIV